MRALPVALTLVLSAGAGPAARAQTPPPAPQPDAGEAFAAGERAFGNRDYARALEWFRRAFALRPHDAVRFNVAVCLERLSRHRAALLEYEAAAASPQLDATVRARAQAQAARVREQLGTLLVTGTAPGALLLVDGEQICRLPCPALLDPGEHQVLVRDGSDSRPLRVTVRRGETVALRLEAVKVPPAGPPAGAPTSAPAPSPARRVGPGPLTWIGAGLAVLGAAGVVGFGVRAQQLHDDYVAAPSSERRQDGLLMRNLANAALAVGVVGVVALAVDLFWLARRPVRAERPALRLTQSGLRLQF
jgi:hypothetical protein